MVTDIQADAAVDVVLATPPTELGEEYGSLAGGGTYRPPLNLLNLAASVKAAGYSARIVDGVILGGMQAALDAILGLNPRYVGLTSMTAQIHTCAELARRIRLRSPGTRTILGGIHLTTLPDETMQRYPQFDIGVIGEGDATIVELLSALSRGADLRSIDGLILRNGNGLITTGKREPIKNLDSLPLPAWDLMPDYVKTYQPTMSRKTRLPSAYIVTSRGCPFACSFCNNVVHGRTFRSYSVPYIMKMIDTLVDRFGIRDLTIYDENLALNRKRIVGLCKALIESGYDLTWSCDARVDCVDDEVLRLMRRAGCRSIWFGMESGNDRILKRYNKRIALDDCRRAVALARRHRIKASGSFIIGGPGETEATIKDTIRFARELHLDYFVPFYYTPVPGTPDYLDIKSWGTCDLDYRSATMARPTFAPHGMTFDQVRYWYNRSIRSFYSQPRIVGREVRSMGPWNLAANGLRFVSSGIRSAASRRLNGCPANGEFVRA